MKNLEKDESKENNNTEMKKAIIEKTDIKDVNEALKLLSICTNNSNSNQNNQCQNQNNWQQNPIMNQQPYFYQQPMNMPQIYGNQMGCYQNQQYYTPPGMNNYPQMNLSNSQMNNFQQGYIPGNLNMNNTPFGPMYNNSFNQQLNNNNYNNNQAPLPNQQINNNCMGQTPTPNQQMNNYNNNQPPMQNPQMNNSHNFNMKGFNNPLENSQFCNGNYMSNSMQCNNGQICPPPNYSQA